jgi:hypothetical protein
MTTPKTSWWVREPVLLVAFVLSMLASFFLWREWLAPLTLLYAAAVHWRFQRSAARLTTLA